MDERINTTKKKRDFKGESIVEKRKEAVESYNFPDMKQHLENTFIDCVHNQ